MGKYFFLIKAKEEQNKLNEESSLCKNLAMFWNM